MRSNIIILTGERGVGKSAVCRATIAQAQAQGYTCGGLITQSSPNGNDLILCDVQSGETRRLTCEPGMNQAIPHGRFHFDPRTLAWGNAILTHSTPCHLLVVDELGPLELERKAGLSKAFDVLLAGNFALALVVVRPNLVIQIQFRMHTSATTVLSVTPENRDSLPSTLLEILGQGTKRY